MASATASSFLALPSLAPKSQILCNHAPASVSLVSLKFHAKPISVSSPLRTSRFVRNVAVSDDLDQDDFSSDGDEEQSPPDFKLFVGNLAFSVDNAQLAGLFESVGSVETVEVITDRETGRSRGFAFVTMSSMEDVKAAAEKFNGFEFEGRLLRVNYGPPPPKREVNFNRGGGGYESRGSGGGGGFSSENKLYVSNLSWGVDDDALGSLFGEQGNVLEAKVIYDRDSGRSRGFGFVTYSSAEEVSSAIEALDGADLDGRPIRVSVAEGGRQRRSF